MEHRRRKKVALVLHVHYETKFGENLFVRYYVDGSPSPLTKRMEWTENNFWKTALIAECNSIRYRYFMEDVTKTNFHWVQ
jgi:hypothetical protein